VVLDGARGGAEIKTWNVINSLRDIVVNSIWYQGMKSDVLFVCVYIYTPAN
jgi:hypothetical protein